MRGQEKILRMRCHHLYALCVGLLGACGNHPHHGPASTVVDGAVGASGSPSVDAGSTPGSTSGAVVCGGVVCTEVPQILAQLGGQPCCSAAQQCGAHVSGNVNIMDICVTLMVKGDPNFDCMTEFDPQLFAYRYGCCLPDRVCGEEPLGGPSLFGCGDPRIAGLPIGPACDPAHTCKRHDTPCTQANECCPLSAKGTACASFNGSASVCALYCDTDEQCPTHCCRPTQTGDRACAPAALCGL
jgi:hypothetical protein